MIPFLISTTSPAFSHLIPPFLLPAFLRSISSFLSLLLSLLTSMLRVWQKRSAWSHSLFPQSFLFLAPRPLLLLPLPSIDSCFFSSVAPSTRPLFTCSLSVRQNLWESDLLSNFHNLFYLLVSSPFITSFLFLLSFIFPFLSLLSISSHQMTSNVCKCKSDLSSVISFFLIRLPVVL